VSTVLVVDDSPIDRRLAGGLLEKQFGCTVRYAADGKEALAQMAQELPDLVLTDLQMPEMDGLELVTAVKRDYPLVPVVLMTAQGSEEVAARALREGAASYVTKRRLADDLLPTAQRILLGSHEDRMHSQLMHYLESSEAVFVLRNDPGLIKALVAHVQQELRCLPLGDETERLRVGLALEEALTNACYHGNLEMGTPGKSDREAFEQRARERLATAPYRDRKIHAMVRISRAEAVFVVRDEGPGFNPSAISDVPDAARDTGRGIVLMRTIMDEVRYNAAGNEVTLVKRCVTEPPCAEEESGNAGS
jgi:CheY-like chemotaxis protein